MIQKIVFVFTFIQFVIRYLKMHGHVNHLTELFNILYELNKTHNFKHCIYLACNVNILQLYTITGKHVFYLDVYAILKNGITYVVQATCTQYIAVLVSLFLMPLLGGWLARFVCNKHL